MRAALRSLALGAILLAVGALPARASAQSIDPAGAITASMLISDGNYGGSAMLDVWAAWAFDPAFGLRVGGFLGGGAIPSDRDDHNRVMMPVGLSIAANFDASDLVAIQVRARAGLWAGATQSEKLTLGPFLGGGAYLGLGLGEGALLLVGADAWAVIASDTWRERTGPDDPISASTWVIAPGLSLSWTPESARMPAPEEGEP